MKHSFLSVFLVVIMSMICVNASAGGLEGISAYSSGGAIMQTNDLINSGSQLSWTFSNNSSVNVTLLSLQLIDGVTNREGNLMDVNKIVGAGSSLSYNTTIGGLGIHVPVTCRFRYSYNGNEYYTDAVYKESSVPDITSDVKLTITATGNGTVTYNGSSIRNSKETFSIRFLDDASISFTPDYGYRLKSVKVNNSDVTSRLSGNQYRISLIMNNTTVEVEFEAIPTKYYTLKYTVDGVTYKTYQLEAGATITPEPWPTKDGYSFSGWSDIPKTMPDYDVTIMGTFTLMPISNPVSIDGVNYKLDSNTMRAMVVAGEKQYSGNIVIPSQVTYYGMTYNVTSVGKMAFQRNTTLTSVKLPYTLSSIGEEAFGGCTNLASIVVPESVTEIGIGAFWGCEALTSFNIPDGITRIAESTLWGCKKLTEVTIPQSVVAIDEGAFKFCSSLGSITIPGSVRQIGESAFRRCNVLTEVYCYAMTVPETVETAFDESPTQIATLYVPASAVDAYKKAWPWSGFKNIIAIGSTPDNSVVSGFCGESLTYSYNKEDHKLTISGNGDMVNYDIYGENDTPWSQYSDDIQSVTIESGVTSIGNFAFYRCGGITSVTIPSTVKNIGSSAFENCTNLKSLTLNEGLQVIGGSSFEGCLSLTTLTIPSTVNSILINALKECENLKDVYCFATTVPETDMAAFDKTPTESATLHVSASAIDAYKAIRPWSGFREIVTLEGDGILGVNLNDDVKAVYSMRGEKLGHYQKGINIIKMKDGTIKKVFLSSPNTFGK